MPTIILMRTPRIQHIDMAQRRVRDGDFDLALRGVWFAPWYISWLEIGEVLVINM
jgi:hypothetical protein